MSARLTDCLSLDVIAGCLRSALTGTPGLAATGASRAARASGTPRMKRTYQASKVRRARTHGFLVRMKSRGGRAVINARRAKGRKRLSV